jgi:hypothetical protein
MSAHICERIVDLERTVHIHDAAGDREASARARLALGRALLAAHDPSGREILEDAGTCFEALGDEAAVLEIDAALRDAADRIEESPRSFQETARRRSSVPPPDLDLD